MGRVTPSSAFGWRADALRIAAKRPASAATKSASCTFSHASRTLQSRTSALKTLSLCERRARARFTPTSLHDNVPVITFYRLCSLHAFTQLKTMCCACMLWLYLYFILTCLFSLPDAILIRLKLTSFLHYAKMLG